MVSCNFDLASTRFTSADDWISVEDDGDDDGDVDDDEDLQAEPSRQAGNTTDTNPSVLVHVGHKVWALVPLIFHFVLLCLEHSQLRVRELHLNSPHFDFPVVLMWWNISRCKLTRWKWTKLDT